MNEHHSRGVANPHYSMENSLRKHLKKFKRDPTVGYKVMDLLSRYLGLVGGTARPDAAVVEY